MFYHHTVCSRGFASADLRTLMARASPLLSGHQLAGVAAADAQERVAAQMALADVPLAYVLSEAVVPYEEDAVTRFCGTIGLPVCPSTRMQPNHPSDAHDILVLDAGSIVKRGKHAQLLAENGCHAATWALQ